MDFLKEYPSFNGIDLNFTCISDKSKSLALYNNKEHLKQDEVLRYFRSGPCSPFLFKA